MKKKVKGKKGGKKVKAVADIIEDAQAVEPDDETKNIIAQELQNIIDNFDSLSGKEKEEAIKVLQEIGRASCRERV